MYCDWCDKDLTFELFGYDSIWDLPDAQVTCPYCKNKIEIHYEEAYDSETNEEWNYWWTTKVGD